jgi:hypothetical protein
MDLEAFKKSVLICTQKVERVPGVADGQYRVEILGRGVDLKVWRGAVWTWKARSRVGRAQAPTIRAELEEIVRATPAAESGGRW